VEAEADYLLPAESAVVRPLSDVPLGCAQGPPELTYSVCMYFWNSLRRNRGYFLTVSLGSQT
jgi:hypothetical protein